MDRPHEQHPPAGGRNCPGRTCVRLIVDSAPSLAYRKTCMEWRFYLLPDANKSLLSVKVYCQTPNNLFVVHQRKICYHRMDFAARINFLCAIESCSVFGYNELYHPDTTPEGLMMVYAKKDYLRLIVKENGCRKLS